MLAIPSHWSHDEQAALQQELDVGRQSIHWHSALLSDLSQVLRSASEPERRPHREVGPDRPALEKSEASVEPASLDDTITSFLHGFSADGLLVDDLDEQTTSSGDVVDLESSLNDAEASPVFALAGYVSADVYSFRSDRVNRAATA